MRALLFCLLAFAAHSDTRLSEKLVENKPRVLSIFIFPLALQHHCFSVLYIFWSCSQASGSRRSSFSNPPQPLLNAVRSKQDNFTSAFPVTWAQKVAFSSPTSPTKSPQKSPSRLVPSAGASAVRKPTNTSPWSASTSPQSYGGNYYFLFH